MRQISLAALLVLAPYVLPAQTAKPEQPVGLVLSGTSAKLIRANSETALSARPGDLLFTDDILKSGTDPASFLFCPAKSIETLTPAGEVRFEASQARVKAGKLAAQAVNGCTLPQTLRVAVASQQHYGVTMTRGAGQPETPAVPNDRLPPAVIAELTAAGAQIPADDQARLAAATVFERHALFANALEQYNKLRVAWPDAVWLKSKIFDLEQTLAEQAAAKPTTTSGQTYALLIGVSKYKKPELSLQFADADASSLFKLLESPRGGGVNSKNITLLTDELATTAAVRNAFQDMLKQRASKSDTVIILVAGHGTVEVPGTKSAFILTYDADPQDLASTALPVSELQSLFERELDKVGRVVLFADVCKAGTIGSIKNTTVSADVQRLGDAQGELFGLLASRPTEVSIEGPQFGGGHGVFSYFVLKGMSGAADTDHNGIVDASELVQYVSSQVSSATSNHQHPREFGTYENNLKLSDPSKPGIEITRIWDSARDPLYLASLAPTFVDQSGDVFEQFSAAIRMGRLSPDQPASAFDALRGIQSQSTPERYLEARNQLRVALENRAQGVLLQYLAGDQNPQSRDAFERGGRDMAAARTLTHESLLLEAREDFFEGRALLFDSKFVEAQKLLEQSIRIDAGAAYGYNALGIAYLEQARYDEAIRAFRDAFQRAQHWSYPLHNEALARVESGDTNGAIRLYQHAMRLTPTYSYLPYNLGLVYQRVHRNKDAEAAYRKAMSLAPTSAEPYNALGTLKASEGKNTDAEKLYREAISKNLTFLAARHNLALLLASTKRQPEAIQLWRENLRESPNHLPSVLSLAETLGAMNDHAGAIEQYRRALAIKPGYPAARVALAAELSKTGDADGALGELKTVLNADSRNVAALELTGDIEKSRGQANEARQAYSSALNATQDRDVRKRLRAKLKSTS